MGFLEIAVARRVALHPCSGLFGGGENARSHQLEWSLGLSATTVPAWHMVVPNKYLSAVGG